MVDAADGGGADSGSDHLVTIDGLTVTHLSLRSRGQLIGDGGEVQLFYPIEVSVGLSYQGAAARIPVVLALGEPPDPAKTLDEQPDLGFCLVGGFYVDHPGGGSMTEAIASATMYVPKGCLGATEQSRKVSPIVLLDPDETIPVSDRAAVTRHVAFMKQNDVDHDMQQCRIDATPGSTLGTCQIEATVEPSPGLDFEIADLTAESSVIVLDKCPAGADPERPESYRCNSSIVPELASVRDANGALVLDANGNAQILLDAEGKPVQATYDDNGTQKPKWVYGAADLALDLTVIVHGEDDSEISSGEEAMRLGPGDDEAAVNNVLDDHGLQIRYQIRPADIADEAAWKPLYLHKQGEQAKAGEGEESGQEQEQFEETQAVPATPHYYSHGLYVENDCGERNKNDCDANLRPRTDIVSGEWSNETNFTVRACLVPVDEAGAETAELDERPGNNCRELPVKIVRRNTSGSSTNASSYAYNYQWADGEGRQNTLRLAWGFHTWNKLDTGGASVDNEAAVTLGSDLIGYLDILKAWASGAALVSGTGSFYDYGISSFGVKLWGDAKAVAEYHSEEDWHASKERTKSTIVWAGAVPVNVEIRVAGVTGVVVNLDVIAVDAPLNPDEESESFLIDKTKGSTRIGLAQLAVTPYGQMTATASASVSALAVRAGVAGELVLFNLRTPLTGRLWWGATSLTPLTLKAGAWADLKMTLTVMSGRIYLFAENVAAKWCRRSYGRSWWRTTVWYPCGSQWNQFWDFTLASWSGWTWNQTLWSSPYVEYTLE